MPSGRSLGLAKGTSRATRRHPEPPRKCNGKLTFFHRKGSLIMKSKALLLSALFVSVLTTSLARAEDLRAAMEGVNARWLQAYNTNSPQAFLDMYTNDAVLMPPGSPPVNGREAITQFWENRLKPGNRKNHTFEILSAQQDGKTAYQVNRWTADLIKDTGETTKLSGNSVRVFERQSDGGWLIKVHIFNVQ